MPNPNNLFTPFSVSTSALPGTATFGMSGTATGVRNATDISTMVMQEMNLGERDSLLGAIDFLSKVNEQIRNENPAGSNFFPKDLQNLLEFIQNGAASTVNQILLSPAITVSQISQLPRDVSALINALLHSVDDSEVLSKTREASTLNMEKEVAANKTDLSANGQALSEQLKVIKRQLKLAIKEEFKIDNNAAKINAQLVKTSAAPTFMSAAGSAGTVATTLDLIGSFFREISATVIFSQQESINPKINNIYQALSACSQSVSSNNNSEESFRALLNLEKAIHDCDPATEMFVHHKVTSPSLSVLLRMIISEPFVKSLISFNASAIALTKAHQILTKEKDHLSELTGDSAAKASLIKDFSGGNAESHSENVSQFCDYFDAAIKQIDNELPQDNNYKLVGTSAQSTLRSDSALIIASSLVTGLTGLISREFSGSLDFSKNDKGSHQECQDVSKTRSKMTGADLDKLMTRVCNLHDRIQRCHDLGVSAPVLLGATEAITTGSLICSLNMIAGMYSALRELRTLADSPSIPLQLKDEEKEKAAKYAQNVHQSNQNTANCSGTGMISEQLSLEQRLGTVMEKVVLTHRAGLNFTQPQMNDRADLDAFAKSTIAFSQGNSTGFLLGSVGILALVSLESGIGLEALFVASRLATAAQRLSDGIDRLELANGFKFNLSFLSNASRLTEKSMTSSSTVQSSTRATYLAAESAFSRSLMVALCHSGALRDLLRRIAAREEERLIPLAGALLSSQIADAIIPHLEPLIKDLLDEAEIHHHPIPGLNADMASTLASASKASIATALSTHSMLLAPFIKSIVATRKASVINEAEQNEALFEQSSVSAAMSSVSNIIQAFTRHFKEEIRGFADPYKNSTVAQTGDSLIMESMLISCGVSLLVEELIEMTVSRSLTLINKEKASALTSESSENMRKETGLFSEAIAEDSGWGKDLSSLHAFSALRLTLSHLGVALGNFATELKLDPKLLKDDLELHTFQRKLIDCLASSLSQCTSAISGALAILSNLPMSSAGSVESIREAIVSFDHILSLRNTHSSEDYTQSCGSDSTLLTGMATDCMFNIFSLITKLLLQMSVLGLNTTLSMAKMMEILSLHPRPEEALMLEIQRLSEPNGLSENLNQLSRGLWIGSSVGTAATTMGSQTEVSQSTLSTQQALQNAVDRQIEQIALLDDDDENEDKKIIGLKTFYKLLVQTLMPGKQQEDYDDLIERLHHGGLSLTNYHSDNQGITGSNQPKHNNHLISNNLFLDCDDAAAIQYFFINRAYAQERLNDESILDKLKVVIIQYGQLSEKAEQRWEFIVNSVIERLVQGNNRARFMAAGESRLNQHRLEERKQALLHHWEYAPIEIIEELSVDYEAIP